MKLTFNLKSVAVVTMLVVISIWCFMPSSEELQRRQAAYHVEVLMGLGVTFGQDDNETIGAFFDGDYYGLTDSHYHPKMYTREGFELAAEHLNSLHQLKSLYFVGDMARQDILLLDNLIKDHVRFYQVVDSDIQGSPFNRTKRELTRQKNKNPQN